MAFHLVYDNFNTKFEKLCIINKVRNRFEPNWVNLVFKPIFTIEILCIMIITSTIL